MLFLSGLLSPLVTICASSELRRISCTRLFSSLEGLVTTLHTQLTRKDTENEVDHNRKEVEIGIEEVPDTKRRKNKIYQCSSQKKVFTVTNTKKDLEKLNLSTGILKGKVDATAPGLSDGQDKIRSLPNDVQLYDVEYQNEWSSQERLSIVIGYGKKRLMNYDPVNNIEDFTTKSEDYQTRTDKPPDNQKKQQTKY